MRVAFLTEMGFAGTIPDNHQNMRTEFAWMNALKAFHYNIHLYDQVKDYDVVFVIFPKATVKLNRVGVEMTTPGADKDISIYGTPIIETLKKNNSKVCYVQEGPADFFEDYDLPTQFNFYNQLAECDVIFAHNMSDIHFYKGLFPETNVHVIPSLMVDPNILPKPEQKTIIGGNFAHWYSGFKSYVTATEFGCDIYVPSSHCKRPGEEQVPGLKHLPWVMWNGWMEQLASFKYAVNLMPTVAAGTFSMNCAYFGIPCIGNEKVDTQRALFPDLCVDVNDVHMARHLAIQLVKDYDFYLSASSMARKLLRDSWHFDKSKWLAHIKSRLK